MINQPDPLVASIDAANSFDASCNGEEDGSIELSVAGGTPGYTYDWTEVPGPKNPKDRVQLSAGDYTVIVTDANGCMESMTMTVNEPNPIMIVFTVTNVSCAG